MKKSLTIQSQSRTYDALLLDNMDALLAELGNIKNAVSVIDKHIEQLYPEFIAQLKKLTPVLSIEATEETKTLIGVEAVLKFLQEHNATKATTIIGIGGGIAQDIASFAAHIYYRGIPFVFVPTTLLAMSDSCIGAKCGLNYHGFKNQIGAFHSPDKVLIWTGFINSLPEDAILSGYGEIFKLMLIGSEPLYKELIALLTDEGFRNSATAKFIYHSLEIKKGFIEEDEFDTGVRRILNYGHTFGHALELATHYEIPHGMAVVRGIDIANYIAYRRGLLGEARYLEIHSFIEDYFNCAMPVEITADALIANVQRDKKISNGKLNMILLAEIGQLKIEPVSLDLDLKHMIQDYINTTSVVCC